MFRLELRFRGWLGIGGGFASGANFERRPGDEGTDLEPDGETWV